MARLFRGQEPDEANGAPSRIRMAAVVHSQTGPSSSSRPWVPGFGGITSAVGRSLNAVELGVLPPLPHEGFVRT
jgi:hypothetical protein